MKKIPYECSHVGTEKKGRVGFLILSTLPSSEQSKGVRFCVMFHFSAQTELCQLHTLKSTVANMTTQSFMEFMSQAG